MVHLHVGYAKLVQSYQQNTCDEYSNHGIQVRELWKAIMASPQRLAQFKELQRDGSDRESVGPIHDLRTRWNSSFEMLARALRLQDFM